MKNIFNLLFVFGLFFASSCIEQEYPVWSDSIVEWDATVMNGPALGKTFPLLIRQPRPTFALAAADPLITRASGVVTLRVNFVSPQRPSDETISFKVVTGETTAIAGTHYTVGTTAIIPANSSFVDVPIQILNPGQGTAPVFLVLEIEGNETISPSERYKMVGIRINQ